MLQTGTLYSIVNNESSIESKEPIPNVYIYFSQNNVRKLTTKTDAQGKFRFDLPLGSYQVTVSQGATSQVYQLAGGAPFELTSASEQDAFEEWVLAPIYLKPEENPLVVLMNNLVLDARKSATDAKTSADRAEQAMKNKRDIDDNNFSGEILVKAKDSTGTGVFLQDSKGTVRGQMVSNSYGLQFMQKQDDGTAQSFTFPRFGKGGEIAMKEDVEKKIDKSDTVGSGKVMREGARGVLSSSNYGIDWSDGFWSSLKTSEVYTLNSNFNHAPVKGYCTLTVLDVRTYWKEFGLMSRAVGSLDFFLGITKDDSVEWAKIRHSKNTTVDSNGFIKEASPIIKLFDNKIEANDSFKEKPEFKKIDTGVYQISGTLGLAKDGWYIEVPRDRNGFPYFLVEWEQDENNVVTIRTFKRKIDIETLDFVNGEPVDIGEDQRWIDLRFHEEPEEIESIEEEV